MAHLNERSINLAKRDDLAAWCIERARKENLSLYRWLDKYSEEKYCHDHYSALELIKLYNELG